MSDWFADNAPGKVPSKATGDWFADNAPSATGSDLASQTASLGGGPAPDAGASGRSNALMKAPHELRGYTDNELNSQLGQSPYGVAPNMYSVVNAPEYQGVQNVKQGVEQIAGSTNGWQGYIKDPSAAAQGLHRVISGTGQLISKPAILASALVNPVGTVGGVGAGLAAQSVASHGLKAVGVPDAYSDLIGDGVGIVAGGKAGESLSDTTLPEAAAGIRDGVDNVQAAINNVKRVDPKVAINKALRPTPSDSGFTDELPQTLANIKAVNPYNGISGNESLIDASTKGIDKHQAYLEQWMERARNAGVTQPGDSIFQAGVDAIPDTMWREDPEAASAIVGKMRSAYDGQQIGVDDLRQLLKEKNAELDSFYNKAEGKQSASVTSGTPEAVVKAQRDEIADKLYKLLDPENDGAGPRQIQRETGNMTSLRDAAIRRRNAIIAEKPESKLAAVASLAKIPMKLVSDNPLRSITSLPSPAKAFTGESDALIKSAFKGIEPAEPPPLPAPYSPYRVSGRATAPARAIAAGPGYREMPSIAPKVDWMGRPYAAEDPSGPIPGGQPQRNPGYYDPKLSTIGLKMKQLPGGMVPPGDSSITLGSTLADPSAETLVKIKNPTTGRDEYVPRWMIKP